MKINIDTISYIIGLATGIVIGIIFTLAQLYSHGTIKP